MPQVQFSLKEKDRTRYIKDRVVRALVTSGGITVFLALVLIFFYLVTIVLPIFSSAEVTPLGKYRYESESPAVWIGVDNYGENLFVFDKEGRLTYLSLPDHDKSTPGAEVLLTKTVIENPGVFSESASGEGWYGYGTADGKVSAVRPKFNVSFTDKGKTLTPDSEILLDGEPLILDDNRQALIKLALSVDSEQATFVAMTAGGKTVAKHFDLASDVVSGDAIEQRLIVPQFPASISDLMLSPGGRQLFTLSGSELYVSERKRQGYSVRDVIDLSRDNKAKSVSAIYLLAGAQSLLVTHEDGTVSQWFDVQENGEKTLTFIRELYPDEGLALLLPNSHRKGFYTFHHSGVLEGHYTTSENKVFSEPVFDRLPDMVAGSVNEQYLITKTGDELSLYHIDNQYPEISFSALWQKVWYENYPEPEYVWQSTAASDIYEAKLSFIPITFGTIKAALFCMLISVPVAVLGAIYTAYFMTPSMRRVVKPTIELMEALPTVIIGFLAGMWLAPIVENNLPAVLALFIVLPVSVVVIGAFWSLIPKHILKKMPNGWHALMLIPVLFLIIFSVLNFSGELERQFFGGDARVFLAGYGIEFDQRNALIIGLAMGFAVIPTVFTIAEDAIFSVPKHLSDGSLALGATQWQTLIYVVLLTASPGIFSAVMVGLGRAVGETMIVLMATGNTPIMDWNILEGMRTLSATIAVEMPESEVGSSHYRLLFLSALILFIFTFAVNSLAEIVRQRLRDKYSSM